MVWFTKYTLLFLTGLIVNVWGRPMSFFDTVEYLRRYHYLGDGIPDPVLSKLPESDMNMAIETGLRMFQMIWDLPVTGVMDDVTAHMMQQPRCGMPDIEDMDDLPDMDSSLGRARALLRNRRYLTQGSSWDRKTLYYRISQYTPDLPPAFVDKEIRRAFKVWSDVTPLEFIQVYNDRADIDIRFASGSHGDGFDFDQAGGTLAHAFYPQYGGAAHFDDAETWTIGAHYGTNLFQVAAHEFGHALGLRHSDVHDALMYPFYPGFIQDFTLHSDDIAGIQAIYGPREVGDTPTTPSMPDMCEDGVFDAITTQIVQGSLATFVFRGEYYLRIDENGVAPGYPHLIADDWAGVRTVDAALTLEYERWQGRYQYRRVTYLFSGDRYYMFVDMQLEQEGNIEADWGLPSNLDAIFQWSSNGKIYAIKGQDVYRISGIESRHVSPPRPLLHWGLSNVDAAFMATNVWGMRDTIFFSGNQYYKIDDTTHQVAAGYPRSTPGAWLGCKGGEGTNLLYLGREA